MVFKAHKVVSSLPSPLEPNNIYLVRVGDGFELYCSDQTGTIAHKINDNRLIVDSYNHFYNLPNPLGVGLYLDNTSHITNNDSSVTTQGIRSNKLYLIPFIVNKSVKINELTCSVVTAFASTQARLGVYKQNNNIDLLFSCIPDCTTTGLKQFSCDFSLLKDSLYYIAITLNNESVALFRGFRPIYCFGRGNVNTSSLTDTTRVSIFYQVSGVSFGDLPIQILNNNLTFDNDNFNSIYPLVCFKIAEIL